MSRESIEMTGSKIAWLVPFVEAGSGGLQTVFRHVSHLQSLGAECHVIGCFEEMSDSAQFMVDIIRDVYQCEPDRVIDTGFSDEEYDVAIATLNTTVPYLLDLKTRKRAYFVQDYESYFCAVGYQYLMAENSYCRDDLSIITIGRWLVHKLHQTHGIYAHHTDFGADQTIYHPIGIERQRAVCAIVQPDKDRRCPQLIADTFELIYLLDPSIKLIAYGSDKSFKFAVPVETRGLLTKPECNELYNECSIGICISLTNPSRIPFEMMAAGLPPVDVYRDNTLWDFCADATTLATPDPASLATAVVLLMNDQERLNSMSLAGLAFMESRAGDVEQQDFARALMKILDDTVDNNATVSKTYLASPVVALPEVRALDDAINSMRVRARLTPAAAVSDARYIQVEIDGITPEEAQAGVSVWAKIIDRPVPLIGCYEAFEVRPGLFRAQIDKNDFDGQPCLCHLFVLRRATDIDEESLLAKRSIRLVEKGEITVDNKTWKSAGEDGHTLLLSFGDKPFVLNAKTAIKYFLTPERIHQLQNAAARFR